MNNKSLDSLTTLVTPPLPFHLEYTLKCGQIFRWRNFQGGYAGFLENFPIFIEPNEGRLRVTGSSKLVKKLGYFFRWDDPLEKILSFWGKDPVLKEAAGAFRGLRLIRQDCWSSLVGFVLSIVSNIPKIETSLEKLASRAGERLVLLETRFHATPPPERIACMKESTLRSLGIGFRARYLRECAQKIAQGFPLQSLRHYPYLEARKALMELPGIGEKVADCILLFGLGHLQAFPVDVWMKRILEHYYFKDKQKTEKYLSAWGRDKFGPWAGYAQQYLYTFGRWKLDRNSPFRDQACSLSG